MFDGFSHDNILKIKLISLYFTFGKHYYFVLRVKQQIFDEAQLFKINNVNHAIANCRENERNLLTPFAIILKLSRLDITHNLTNFS